MSLNWTSFIFEMQNVSCSPAPWTHAVLKDQASLRAPNMGESLRHAVCGGHALIKPVGSYKYQHKTLHIVVSWVLTQFRLVRTLKKVSLFMSFDF